MGRTVKELELTEGPPIAGSIQRFYGTAIMSEGDPIVERDEFIVYSVTERGWARKVQHNRLKGKAARHSSIFAHRWLEMPDVTDETIALRVRVGETLESDPTRHHLIKVATKASKQKGNIWVRYTIFVLHDGDVPTLPIGSEGVATSNLAAFHAGPDQGKFLHDIHKVPELIEEGGWTIPRSGLTSFDGTVPDFVVPPHLLAHEID